MELRGPYPLIFGTFDKRLRSFQCQPYVLREVNNQYSEFGFMK